ncbi:UMP kinase [Anaerolineales bacterium HSG6]|nr:UMP kinase [Anaerolineales bacterium HSG6]MDM8532474.1 UMP kinase [Anaerolineales bacterium HSG25]
MTENPQYRRVLVKLSGEAMAIENSTGISPLAADSLAETIKYIHDIGVEVAIVIGAGNLWRGKDGLEHGMDRSTADHMGMVATVMNALALGDALERIGIDTRVQTAIEMRAIAEPYIRKRAIRHLEKGRVIILGAGTGNPYFTTDTAAALRAMEINANLLVKATKVDGIYDSDPVKNPNAKKFDTLTYMDAIKQNLQVMDGTAFTLCMDNQMPIIVLDLWQKDSLKTAVLGRTIGTLINT